MAGKPDGGSARNGGRPDGSVRVIIAIAERTDRSLDDHAIEGIKIEMTLRAILRAHAGLDDIAGEFLAGFSDPRFLWLGLGAPSGQNGQGDEAAARDALGCFARRLR